MIVRKDATMDNLAAIEDDDFDTLLNASSLGAPHVRAETEPIPADVRRRLSRAAGRPVRQEVELAERDESDCAPDASRSSLLLQLDDLRTRVDDLWSRLYQDQVRPVMILETLGAGKTASAGRLLWSLAFEERTARAQALPAWPQRLWQRALEECGYMTWEPWTGVVTGDGTPAAWHMDWTLSRDDKPTLAYGSWSVPPIRPELPLYVLDDLSDSPARPSQSRVRPAQMTELLVFEEAAPGCAAMPWPERRQVAQGVGTWLLDCWEHSPGQTQPSPGTAHSSWEQRAKIGAWLSHPFAPRSSLVLATQCTDAAQRVSGLHAFHNCPLTLLLPHADALVGRWCNLMSPSTVYGPMRADEVLLIGLDGGDQHARWRPGEAQNVPRMSGGPGRVYFAGCGFNESWPEPQPYSPAAVTRPALRMWTEHAEDGVIEHALLPMTVHQKRGGRGAQVPVRLTYRPADPYAVEAVFYLGDPGDEVVWSFARDLLVEGLEHRAGEGDVTVWSPPDPRVKREERRALIHLSSPKGTALLSASHAQLKQYLHKTLLLVSAGTEHQEFGSTLDRLEDELGELACPGFSD